VTTPLRYTVHYYEATGHHYVFDNLTGRVISADLSSAAAGSAARVYKQEWRGRCDRWKRAEEHDDRP